MTARAGSALRSSSDPTLVEMARAGDDGAFDRLVETRLDRAYRTALAILRTDWDARDACQDAFVAAWRELPRLRDVESFDAWLDRIVVNQCRAVLRKRRRVREIQMTADGGFEEPAASPTDSFADVDAIRAALETLGPDDRTILALHHGEGRPVAEIARLIGAPQGTVMWRLYRARRALAAKLREPAE